MLIYDVGYWVTNKSVTDSTWLVIVVLKENLGDCMVLRNLLWGSHGICLTLTARIMKGVSLDFNLKIFECQYNYKLFMIFGIFHFSFSNIQSLHYHAGVGVPLVHVWFGCYLLLHIRQVNEWWTLSPNFLISMTLQLKIRIVERIKLN